MLTHWSVESTAVEFTWFLRMHLEHIFFITGQCDNVHKRKYNFWKVSHVICETNEKRQDDCKSLWIWKKGKRKISLYILLAFCRIRFLCEHYVILCHWRDLGVWSWWENTVQRLLNEPKLERSITLNQNSWSFLKLMKLKLFEHFLDFQELYN